MFYFAFRRKRAEQKLEDMRVVFNNLQENAINDESIQHVIDASYASIGKVILNIVINALEVLVLIKMMCIMHT